MSSEDHLQPSLIRQGFQDMTDSGKLTLSVSFVEESIGGKRLESNVTWTPTFRKQQLVRKGLSVVIRTKIQCDKKVFLVESDSSKKRNLLLVGGHVDNVVDLCGESNVDSKCQCLGNRASY